MNDDDVLGTVRDAMAGVRMRTPVRELVAAGRSRRRRRVGGVVAGTVVGTTLVTALGLPVLTGPRVNAPPVAAGDEVHVHLAAFSVDTNPDGTVTVKLTKRQSLDPEIMRRTLAQAGVPAQITINKWCEPSNPAQDLADIEKVVRQDPHHGKIVDRREKKPGASGQEEPPGKTTAGQEKGPGKTPADQGEEPPAATWMVIRPSAMPPATKLVIGMRTDDYQPDSPSRVAVSMVLVPADAPLTCTTDVPAAPPREPRPPKS
ncbi:hypothetical protein Skr01_37170 [Sphaerisporangium krabiense]|uniref:Uncharacterized protein n=1 Tax=Sphaerisporangium krabiense TaxID=763782 RepID=A0A7W8Z455_9ACTN|nr:hypothetical protein [Sphaerisporangium krabiense]MBB5626713.1 hypothetical protein [Sphaerisporangium krabiense]GII63632.1 hypothetical protein Skr01_37170 [Sphaerisporangium krabiense]